MIAFVFRGSEAVGLVLYRGPGKQAVVKSMDHRIRSKLFRLFNSSFDSLANTLDATQCVASVVTLAPGKPEHFMAVVNHVNANTDPDISMSVMGINNAD